MKKLITFLILSTIFFCTSAQNSKYSLEINPFVRYDKYNEFFAWQNFTGKNIITPSGTSLGLNLNLKYQLLPTSNISLGLGYYRHTVSDIKRVNNLGAGNSWLIGYPSPLFILFYTDKYAYNTLTLNTGFERQFRLKKNYLITTGIDLNGLYTFSQYYHLTNNPDGSKDYRTKDSRFLGILAGLDIGLMKSYKQFNIGPKIKMPVFSSLKTDEVLANDDGTNYRKNWFTGVGLGISFIYKFKTTEK